MTKTLAAESSEEGKATSIGSLPETALAQILGHVADLSKGLNKELLAQRAISKTWLKAYEGALTQRYNETRIDAEPYFGEQAIPTKIKSSPTGEIKPKINFVVKGEFKISFDFVNPMGQRFNGILETSLPIHEFENNLEFLSVEIQNRINEKTSNGWKNKTELTPKMYLSAISEFELKYTVCNSKGQSDQGTLKTPFPASEFAKNQTFILDALKEHTFSNTALAAQNDEIQYLCENKKAILLDAPDKKEQLLALIAQLEAPFLQKSVLGFLKREKLLNQINCMILQNACDRSASVNAMELSATKTFLTRFPKEIINQNLAFFSALVLLNLSWNRISCLPKEIEQLQSLQILKLYKNNLRYLPKEIGKLTRLRTLDLAKNRLETLPEEIGNLRRLDSLNVNLNQLSSLPATIGQLRSLGWLFAFLNKLSEIPKEIGLLSQLHTVSFGGNRLTFLPAEMGQLQRLNSLSLDGNALTTFPEEIAQLPELQFLHVCNNCLTELPLSLNERVFGKKTKTEVLASQRPAAQKNKLSPGK